MKYRRYGNTDMMVSEVGLGCEFLQGKTYDVVKSTIDEALASGINILDCFMSEPEVRSNIGKALVGKREKVFIQGHFRSIWENGQYKRTLELDKTKEYFEDLLSRLQTSYIDLGMIHLIDNEDDYEKTVNGEIYEYAAKLKEKGVIRHIGMSTHNATIALKAAESGKIDGLLFSVNAAYDLVTADHKAPLGMKNDLFDTVDVNGIDPIRAKLYTVCANKGIGITTMKTLGAGTLLNEKSSPFGKAMSVVQCMHYALTRPAIASVLIGMQTPEQVKEALHYEVASDEEKDFSEVLKISPKFNEEGNCVYCNHCQPCSAGIDIAQVSKYLDMARIQGETPATLKEHYMSLEHKASECIECGVCEEACPFGVHIIERMKAASGLFEA